MEVIEVSEEVRNNVISVRKKNFGKFALEHAHHLLCEKKIK